jgi:hypothetical protein
MATPEPAPTAPKTFITYSWDDSAHREWVKKLAIRLRWDGIDVTLDRWHAAPGDQIPAFMDRAIRENDFVIAICTPRFKERVDGRGGGVGYEGDIMTAYAFTGGAEKKFIPVLRRGSWREAAPTWLLGRVSIDLSGDPFSETEYEDLLRTLHGEWEQAPPTGMRPNFGDKERSQPGPAPTPITPGAGPPIAQHQSTVTSARALAHGWCYEEATDIYFDPSRPGTSLIPRANKSGILLREEWIRRVTNQPARMVEFELRDDSQTEIFRFAFVEREGLVLPFPIHENGRLRVSAIQNWLGQFLSSRRLTLRQYDRYFHGTGIPLR